MHEFAAALLEELIHGLITIRGDDSITRAIVRGLRGDVKEHPDMLPNAITAALDKCSLELKPRTNNVVGNPASGAT